jgi:periplasmic copper chaperone A
MSHPGRRWRILSALAVIGGVVLTATPAWAHVEIDPGSEPKGSTVVFSFRVPNEEQNANTVRLDIQFPLDHPFANVLVGQKVGWSFTSQSHTLAKPITTDDGTFTNAVTEVTWTATNGGIPPGAFDLFPVFAGLPKNTSKLTFKAIQTYSNGDLVSWIQTPTKGAPPPEHPAPVLVLTKALRGG